MLFHVAAGMLATIALSLFPAFALAQDAPTFAHAPGAGGGGGRAPATIDLKIKGLKGGKAKVGDRVEVVGTVRPFVGHQKVQVRLGNGGDNVLKANPYVHQVKGKSFGRITLRSAPLLEPGKYRARALKKATAQQAGGIAKSKKFSLKFIDLDPGDRGPAVALFNDLLRDEGYYDTDGHNYGSHTERAVLAFRKVNVMDRNFNANPEIFKLLAEGKGAFVPKYGGSGKHVEVDISRQVMALVNDGETQYVFHVSTGAPATPSDQGTFTFYLKDPGYNSEGMYYSVYYNRGEATHGYASVPDYNASHGCIRNPIPDSVFIYNWIDLGDEMHVYA
ncbi:MAG: hypothetical protein QOI10_2962 [Solirubrobacterales bacterium]|jgi:hypothetical protein|nr:hypothetical protein [Solirubrobacterales bacterium]